MPELPEVTTIVTGINKKLIGLHIKDVWSDWPKIIKNISFNNFKKEISNKKILGAERVGKNILMHLSEGKTILFHMKMTGHLLYGNWVKETSDEKYPWAPEKKGTPLSDPQNKFLHIVFELSNGQKLALSDVRKFAKVVLLKTEEQFDSKDLKNLGPDPTDKNLDYKKFKEILSKIKNGKIKQVLMNQEIISGIGNIYSDEILWEAGIHPEEKVQNISDEKIKDIFKATKRILTESIKLGGDSMSDYRKINGERGEYQNHHRAYRQTGKLCKKKDGGIITRIKVGGRSAHFCETHQKLTGKAER